MTARKGAATNGSATISATSQAAMCNSTIITRFSVPTISAAARPTDTWKSDKRSSRDSGRLALAASAKGSRRGSQRANCSRCSSGMRSKKRSTSPGFFGPASAARRRDAAAREALRKFSFMPASTPGPATCRSRR